MKIRITRVGQHLADYRTGTISIIVTARGRVFTIGGWASTHLDDAHAALERELTLILDTEYEGGRSD